MPLRARLYVNIHDLALSPDGTRVAVAADGHVAAWRVADGASLFDVGPGRERVTFSPDGTTFLTFLESSRHSSSAARPMVLSSMRFRRREHDTAAAGFASGGTQVVCNAPVPTKFFPGANCEVWRCQSRMLPSL